MDVNSSPIYDRIYLYYHSGFYSQTMESSYTTIKWFNSMDNSFYKFITMTSEEKLERIKELTETIIYLKQNPQVNSKQTIQLLQQEINRLTE